MTSRREKTLVSANGTGASSSSAAAASIAGSAAISSSSGATAVSMGSLVSASSAAGIDDQRTLASTRGSEVAGVSGIRCTASSSTTGATEATSSANCRSRSSRSCASASSGRSSAAARRGRHDGCGVERRCAASTAHCLPRGCATGGRDAGDEPPSSSASSANKRLDVDLGLWCRRGLRERRLHSRLRTLGRRRHATQRRGDDDGGRCLGRIAGRRGRCLGRGNRGDRGHHALDPGGARAERRAAAREQSFEGLLGVAHGLERPPAVDGCEPLEHRDDVAGDRCRRRSTEPVLHQRQQAAETMRVLLLVDAGAPAGRPGRAGRPGPGRSACRTGRCRPPAASAPAIHATTGDADAAGGRGRARARAPPSPRARWR